jgi:hypothetical protein
MKTEGIDRVFIGVKNLDKAVEFFSMLFNAEFIELTGPTVDALEQRVAISREAHIELLSPNKQLSDKAPPYMKLLARLLKDRDNVVLGVSYKTKDIEEISNHVKSKGMRIDGILETDEFDDALSWCNYRELIVNQEDTLDMLITFIQYDS